MIIKVSCPKCKHVQNFQPVKADLISSKSKRCVYCGHTFKIHIDQKKSRIVDIKR